MLEKILILQSIYNKYWKNKGYDVFIDVNSIRIGEPWAGSIEKNISQCDIFVVILTSDALSSSYVEQEVLQAQKENKIIVPCINEDVEYNEVKWGLDGIQGIEFADEFKLARKLYSKIKMTKPAETIHYHQGRVSNLKIFVAYSRADGGGFCISY